MKKLLLATAIATLSVSAAQAAPTVYGKALLTADYVAGGDNDTTVTTTHYIGNVGTSTSQKTTVKGTDKTSLNSTGSRIGVKGAEALTANTDVVYQLEYGIDVDSNSNSKNTYDAQGNYTGKNRQDQFYSRDTYLGLSNKNYGTFVAGRLTTIDDNINYVNQVAGGVLGGDSVLATFDGPRANNAAAYFSPSYNGMQFMAMYGLDADQDNTSISDHEQYGAGVKFETPGQPFRAGLTYVSAGKQLTAVRASGDYKINPAITVGALYQMTDYDTKDNENTFTLSGAYKTATPWTVYAQGDLNTNVNGWSDADRQRVVVGGKYAFNPATTGHVYGAYLNNDISSTTGTRVNGTGTVTKVKNEFDGMGIGAGLEYKF